MSVQLSQEDFNANLTRMNTAIDAVVTAVENEGQQIRDYIAAHPQLDTSGLSEVANRLDAIAANVEGIFTPAVETDPVETDPEA